MVQCLKSTFGVYWFYLEFWGDKEGSFGVCMLCFTWGMECEKMILSRTSFCFASQMFYTWSDQNLISDLSLGKHCLGQTSLCVYCSGSSLPRWPWTMSGRTVGVFFISVNDSSRKLQESHKSPIYRRSGSLPAKQDHSMAVACDFTKCGVFSLTSTFSSWLIFVRICFKRNEFLSVIVKPKANMSLKIRLQWFDQDLMNWGFQTFKWCSIAVKLEAQVGRTRN